MATSIATIKRGAGRAKNGARRAFCVVTFPEPEVDIVMIENFEFVRSAQNIGKIGVLGRVQFIVSDT